MCSCLNYIILLLLEQNFSLSSKTEYRPQDGLSQLSRGRLFSARMRKELCLSQELEKYMLPGATYFVSWLLLARDMRRIHWCFTYPDEWLSSPSLLRGRMFVMPLCYGYLLAQREKTWASGRHIVGCVLWNTTTGKCVWVTLSLNVS